MPRKKTNPESRAEFYKFSVSMPGPMYAAVKREALRRVSTVSQVVRDALRDHFDAMPK